MRYHVFLLIFTTRRAFLALQRTVLNTTNRSVRRTLNLSKRGQLRSSVLVQTDRRRDMLAIVRLPHDCLSNLAVRYVNTT